MSIFFRVFAAYRTRRRERSLLRRQSGRRRRAARARVPEVLEPRLPLAADLLISEFMADNETTLQDEDGDASDWIEVFNRGSTAADLEGWHLTDNADRLTQ